MDERQAPGQNDPAQVRQKTKKSERAFEVRQRIGESLRLMYDDVVKQDIPDKLAAILGQLDDSRQTK